MILSIVENDSNFVNANIRLWDTKTHQLVREFTNIPFASILEPLMKFKQETNQNVYSFNINGFFLVTK